MDHAAAQAQRHLAREHDGVGADGHEQLVGEQPLDGRACCCRVGQDASGVLEAAVRRPPDEVLEGLTGTVGCLGEQRVEASRIADEGGDPFVGGGHGRAETRR